jgi:hypothetical protein
MRKFLAISIALLLAVIVFTPAMGYTIKSENSSYSIKSGEKVNYTIGSGTPAHEITSMPVAQKSTPRYSISSEKIAYSFKSTSAPKYSINSGAVTVAAAQPAAQVPAKTETTTEKVPAANVTVPAKVENTTAPAKVENTTKAVTKLSITGIAFEETDNNAAKEANEEGIEGVKINLAQPADTIIANTTTTATGDYSFKDLMPGEYTVTAEIPKDMTVVSPASGKYTVMLAAKNEANKDFAFTSIVKENETAVEPASDNSTADAKLDKAAAAPAAAPAASAAPTSTDAATTSR